MTSYRWEKIEDEVVVCKLTWWNITVFFYHRDVETLNRSLFYLCLKRLLLKLWTGVCLGAYMVNLNQIEINNLSWNDHVLFVITILVRLPTTGSITLGRTFRVWARIFSVCSMFHITTKVWNLGLHTETLWAYIIWGQLILF